MWYTTEDGENNIQNIGIKDVDISPNVNNDISPSKKFSFGFL